MVKNKPVKINFWITEDMWKEIDRIVQDGDEDLNVSIFARRALKTYLKMAERNLDLPDYNHQSETVTK